MSVDTFVVRWTKISLHFLVFAAVAVATLRFYNLAPIIGINYKFLLHAHSHIAMLGWLYIVVAALLVKEFIPDQAVKINKVLGTTVIMIIGMMLSFPFQGYGLVSITFSTFFLFTSYWFVVVFLRKLREKNNKSLANRWIRWALFFLLISSIGPWSLGPIMLFGEKHGTLYNLAIYYYLHFLYNGFLLPAVFGIILKHLENNQIKFNIERAKLFFQLTVYPIIPLYALSLLWLKPSIWVYIIGGLAALMQLVGIMIGWPILRTYWQSIKQKFYKALFGLVLTAYSFKLFLQIISSLPVIAEYVYQTRVFTAIGYIHLVMLGFLSMFILIYTIINKNLRDNKVVRFGLVVFITGLILSEIILFTNGLLLYTKGVSISNYSQWLFYASILMPIGLMVMWVIQLKRKTNRNEATVLKT